MPVTRIRKFLDHNEVKYVIIAHSKAFTAQDIAASAHIPGKELAKTVIVKIDGRLAMTVLPASYLVDFEMLKHATRAGAVELAGEEEFRSLFPGCEVGAMPPFGNLYDMEVFVEEILTEDRQIAFNAGTHTELIQMGFSDFERLVQPRVLSFSAHA